MPKTLIFNPLDVNSIFRRIKAQGTRHSLTQFTNFMDNGTLSKLTIKELKVVIDYLKETKKVRVSKAGIKSNVIENLKKEIYTNSGVQPSGFPRLNNSIFSRKNNSISVSHQRTFPLGINRKDTFGNLKDELEMQKLSVLKRDLTLKGHQSDLYPIKKVLDLHVLHGKKKDKSINFVFDDDDYSKIQKNKYKLHLYCTTLAMKPCNWNKEMYISLNAKPLRVPHANIKLSKKKKRIKRTHPELISNTPLIIDSSNLRQRNKGGNQMKLQLQSWCEDSYCFFLALIENLDIKELQKRIIKNSSSTYLKSQEYKKKNSSNSGKGILASFEDDISFSDEDDDGDEIFAGEEVITLNDPLLMSRIDVPVKGIECVHAQVFDLDVFLEYSATNHCWNCPICSKPLPANQLFIDSKVENILKQVKDDDDIEKVKLNLNGTVTILDPMNEKETNRIIELDLDDNMPIKNNEIQLNSNVNKKEDSDSDVTNVTGDLFSPPKKKTALTIWDLSPSSKKNSKIIEKLNEEINTSNPFLGENEKKSKKRKRSMYEEEEEEEDLFPNDYEKEKPEKKKRKTKKNKNQKIKKKKKQVYYSSSSSDSTSSSEESSSSDFLQRTPGGGPKRRSITQLFNSDFRFNKRRLGGARINFGKNLQRRPLYKKAPKPGTEENPIELSDSD